MALRLPEEIYEALKTWAEKCYPYEGCGLLLGQPQGINKKADIFRPLKNILRDQAPQSARVVESARSTLGDRVFNKGQFEFAMDPQEFYQATLEAEKAGLDVVGVVHTHPDHPAEPSEADAAQPLLAGWANVIAKVDKGRFVEARSWVRDTESAPFSEEPLEIIHST